MQDFTLWKVSDFVVIAYKMSTCLGLWRQFVYSFFKCCWLCHGFILYSAATGYCVRSAFSCRRVNAKCVVAMSSLTKLYVTYQADIFVITRTTHNSIVLFDKYGAAQPQSLWLVYWEGTSRSRDLMGRNLLNVWQGGARFGIYLCHTEWPISE
jgi:hypothetical protein